MLTKTHTAALDALYIAYDAADKLNKAPNVPDYKTAAAVSSAKNLWWTLDARQKDEVLNVPAKLAMDTADQVVLDQAAVLEALLVKKTAADNIVALIKAAKVLSVTRVTEKNGVKDSAQIAYTTAEALSTIKKELAEGVCTTTPTDIKCTEGGGIATVQANAASAALDK